MSIPSDLLDQLLTGYLDDALSSDERARVDSLLQSDPKVSEELAELRELQQSLHAVAEADASVKLRPGFTDRVLGAAVNRARSEGLSEDHPLVRLADQPSISSSRRGKSNTFRYATTLVGLAASIGIVVLMLQPAANNKGVPLAVADVQADPTQPEVAMVQVGVTDSDPESDPVDLAPITPDRVVMNDLANASVPADSMPADSMPAKSETNISGLSNAATAVDPIASSTIPKPQIVDSKATKIKTQNEPIAMQIGAILVLDVRMTAAGHMENAILSAMQKSGLKQADEKELPAELADQLASADGQFESQDLSVIYLQASAKTLDRFYLSLMGDSVGIESVGMSLAMDAPIMKVVKSIVTDPTTVRHDATAVELAGRDGLVEQLAGELSRRDFAPLSPRTAGAMSSSGPDEPAQILLLVR